MKILLKLRAMIERYIVKKGITTFISGMALGIDTWAARIILKLKDKYPHIKLVLAIPCAKQWIKWNEADQEVYHEIVSQADYVHMVSEEPYTAWCMNVRDKWMVDQSRFVVGVWDGKEDGGTWDTIKYARKRQRSIMKLHPETLKVEIDIDAKENV